MRRKEIRNTPPLSPATPHWILTSGKRTLALETLKIIWMPWEALGQSGIESTESTQGCPQGKVTLRLSSQGASGQPRLALGHLRLALGCPRLTPLSLSSYVFPN